MVVVEEVVVVVVPGVKAASRPRRKSWCPNSRCPKAAPPAPSAVVAVAAVILPIGLADVIAIRPMDLVQLFAKGLVGHVLAHDPLLLFCSIGSLRQSRATNVGRDYDDRSQ